MFDALSVKNRWFDETADARGWFDPDLIGSTGAYSVTITAGTVPITGGTIALIYAILEPAVTAGTVPITGATVTPVLGYRDSLTAGTVPITGGTFAPVFAITEAITAGTVSITGSNVTVAYGQTDSLTAGTVPITGGTLAPVFGRTDAITAGTVAITGATVTPVYAQTEAITAGTVPITGAPVSLGGPALDIDFAAGTLDSRITFTRASTATYYDSSGLVATAASGAPRFDYDPATLAPRGLLLEEQRTNILLYSGNLAQAGTWNVVTATWTANDATAPDGTTTAARLTGTTNGSPEITTIGYQSVTTTAATWTASVYLKKGTTSWAYIQPQDSNGQPRAWINLDTGAIGTIEAGLSNVRVDALPNGWYRLSATKTAAAGGAFFIVGISHADNQYGSVAGDSIYAWGAQYEVGAFASSYIPTTTAAATRAADTASMTGTNFSSWYNAAEGTFVTDYRPQSVTGTQPVISANDNTANEALLLYGSGTDPRATVVDGGVTQADLDAGTLAANTFYKLGLAYKLNDFGACVDGGTVATDASGTLPTVTQLLLGADGSNVSNLHVRRLSFYDTRKSDAELQTLTAVAGGTSYSVSVTAGTVPITGVSVTPVYGQIEAITAGTVPITGASVTPVYAITEAITPATVAITGGSVVPVFGRTDAVTAGTVPVTGATVAPVFGRTDSLVAGTVPISGGNITPIWSSGPANYSISITAGTVPVTGQTVSPTYARTEAVTAGTVPITGQAILPIRGYAEVITPNVVPITGATVNPVAGIAVNYTITIQTGVVPIAGGNVIPFHRTFGWRVEQRGVSVWRPEAAHPTYTDLGVPVDDVNDGLIDELGELLVFDEQSADAWTNRADVATSWRPEAAHPSSFTDYVVPVDAEGGPLSGAPGEVLIFEEEPGADAWTSRSRTGGTWRRAA